MSRAVEWENVKPASRLITFQSTTPATQLKDNPGQNYDYACTTQKQPSSPTCYRYTPLEQCP